MNNKKIGAREQSFDNLAGMDSLALRDAALEKLWREFGDLPFDEGTECVEEPFLGFPAGTHRDDVWHWFDERHSRGVHYLLYGDSDGVEPIVWAKRADMCNDCERDGCAYNADGVCRFSLVHGRSAESDDFGCSDIRL